MKRLVLLASILLGAMSLSVQAEETGVSAEAEVQTEGGFFSRTWANIKGFFGGDDEAEAEAEAEVEAKAEAQAEQEPSMMEKAADKTKAGAEWTKEKAKAGAEWTKETAKDATEATGRGIKKGGAAIEGMVSDDRAVEAEANVDAEVEKK
ncbi:MAG: hypothetical protein R3352_04595 [Salinisphaeraceae bacterium]|nr:hypothetical protein [Salinisphaeraceae bacterium]